MEIGVCTTDFERMPADELFEKVHAMGFSCVQLAFATVSECLFVPDGACEIPFSLPDGAAERITSAAARHAVRVACVNGTFNMAHPDPAVRQDCIVKFRGFAKAVKSIGCGTVSLCTGTRNAEYLWRAHPDNLSDAAWADMAEVCRALIQVAEAEDLTLLVEQEASNVVCTPERARKLMDDMGSDRLKMIMDPANLFHAGEAKPENARGIIGHAFDVFGADVRLAHGKDILAGPGLDFCGAGEGIVDFGYLLERLKGAGYAGDMVLHGIKSEQKMPQARAFMQDKMMWV